MPNKAIQHYSRVFVIISIGQRIGKQKILKIRLQSRKQ